MICSVAFGSHWKISASYARQAKGAETIVSGDLGDAVFPRERSPLQESMFYLLDVSGWKLKSVLILHPVPRQYRHVPSICQYR